MLLAIKVNISAKNQQELAFNSNIAASIKATRITTRRHHHATKTDGGGSAATQTAREHVF
jgi:hypothetical protein